MNSQHELMRTDERKALAKAFTDSLANFWQQHALSNPAANVGVGRLEEKDCDLDQVVQSKAQIC